MRTYLVGFLLFLIASTSAIAADTGTRQAQQTVCELTGLTRGKHVISIVNRGPGPVAVDALIVR